MNSLEILNSVQFIEQDLENLKQDFHCNMEVLENYVDSLEKKRAIRKAIIKDLEKEIENGASEIDRFKRNIDSNNLFSENLRISIDTILHQESLAKKEYAVCQKSLSKAEKQLDMLSNEKTNIEELKNIIRAYKALTKTTFVFSSKAVKGIVITKNGAQGFDFSKNIPHSKIVEDLWKMHLE